MANNEWSKSATKAQMERVLRSDHPDWSEDQIQERLAAGSAAYDRQVEYSRAALRR